MKNTKSNPTRNFVKRAQARFLTIDENCIKNMTIFAMSVYQNLRLLSDFSKDFDEIEITIPNLARASKISERKTYQALNELEFEHFVIQRLNYQHIRYGKINSYNVARDYNYFQPVQNLPTSAPYAVPVDKCVQSLTTPASHAGVTAPHAVPPAHGAYLKKQDLSQEFIQKKQNKGQPPVAVSVFSETQEIKNHINQTLANRKESIPDHLVDEIIFYVGIHVGYDAVVKKVNVALKLIRESRWNTPHGYKGITSKSIREKEEREQKAKHEQYQEEARAFSRMAVAVSNLPVPSSIDEYRNRANIHKPAVNLELKSQNDAARQLMMKSLGMR
jgi:hypothetical protein